MINHQNRGCGIADTESQMRIRCGVKYGSTVIRGCVRDPGVTMEPYPRIRTIGNGWKPREPVNTEDPAGYGGRLLRGTGCTGGRISWTGLRTQLGEHANRRACRAYTGPAERPGGVRSKESALKVRLEIET
jgi:hypothetical protein